MMRKAGALLAQQQKKTRTAAERDDEANDCCGRRNMSVNNRYEYSLLTDILMNKYYSIYFYYNYLVTVRDTELCALQ